MQRPIMASMRAMAIRLADGRTRDGREPDAKKVAGAAALALAQACYETESITAPELQAFMVGKFGCSSGRRPSLGIREYVTDRLLKYMDPSIDDVSTALALVDRVISMNQIALTWRTCHRLYASALVLALKFSKDGTYPNSYYAKVAGVLPAEFNALEMAMLQHLDFGVWIGEEEMEEYRDAVGSMAAFFAGWDTM